MQKRFYVYILASRRNGTLYVGVTNDLGRRIREHKDGLADGFTRKYGVKSLVRIKQFDELRGAQVRERQLKRWRRAWKVDLIEERNPDWVDLYPGLTL